MAETTYATLTKALNDIAQRSFHECADVIPNGNGTYTVRDSFSPGEEIVQWTYDGGLEIVADALDHSRLHEPYEGYDSAAHIFSNLGGAVEALKAGNAVCFEYVIVDGYPSTPEDIADDEAGLYDATVGWALIAYPA